MGDRGSGKLVGDSEGNSGGELTASSESDGALQRQRGDEPAENLSDDQRAELLRKNIARSRRQVEESFEHLQDEVGEAMDWRGWVDDHPWEAVGVAFAVGFYVGFR